MDIRLRALATLLACALVIAASPPSSAATPPAATAAAAAPSPPPAVQLPRVPRAMTVQSPTAAMKKRAAAAAAVPPLPTPLAAAPAIATAATPAAGTQLGAGWQAALLTGLTQFLQQRAQEEVFLWLENDLVKRLCDDSYTLYFQGNLLATFHGYDIFPATCAITDPTTPNLGVAFAAALRKDLEGLPIQLATRVFKMDQSLATDIVARLRMLQEGQPPLSVLAGMASRDPPSVEYSLCNVATPNQLACALVGVGVLAEWSGDAHTDAQSLQAELATPASTDPVSTFVTFVNESCAALGNACPLRTLSATTNRDAIVTFLQSVQAIYTLVSTPVSGSAADLAARGGQLITAVLATIDDGEPFLNDTVKAAFDGDWPRIEPGLRATGEFLQGQIAAGVADTLKELQEVLSLNQGSLPTALVTTVTLAADLASAQTAQDVQTALETAAAPLGSWQQKHQTLQISLNAYVGGAIGRETALSAPSSQLPTNWAGGAFAPIGVDFSGRYITNWAFGLFLSALDVGQLMTTPIQPQTGTASGAKTAVAGGTLNVVQVLSPGAYVHSSLGNSPITLGVGVSLAPLLRYYEDSSGQSPYSMFRTNAFLAVDVDLIPFYTARSSDHVAPKPAASTTP